MRGASGGAKPHAQNAAGRARQLAVGRLAVDEVSRLVRNRVRRSRAVAAALFADHEQHSGAPLARRPQPFARGHLRREDTLGIAGAAPVQPPIRDAARDEWGYAVEVRREHDRRFIERGEDVEAAALDRHLANRVAESAQPVSEPDSGRVLAAGRGIDVDQRAREDDRL
jgi:hypothetical protein